MCKGGCKGNCGCNFTSTTKGEKGDPSGVASLGYKVYRALVYQYDTDAPEVIVFENTLGVITWTRSGVGEYIGSCSSLLTDDKVFWQAPNPKITYKLSTDVLDQDTFSINSYDNSSVLTDDLIRAISLEILVYP